MEDLIKRLEAATEGSRELDEAIMSHFYDRREMHIGVMEDDGAPVKDWVWVDRETKKWVSTAPHHFTSSLDAARMLLPDGWRWQLRQDPSAYSAALVSGTISDLRVMRGESSIAATALCIAALKARRS